MQPIHPPTTATPPPPLPSAGASLQHARAVRSGSRSGRIALFFACVAWYRIAAGLASSSANGFAIRFDLAAWQPLIEAVALLFLVLLGLTILRTMERTLVPLQLNLGLPSRPTAREEWSLGAALGWAVAASSALVLVVAKSLHIQFWTSPHAFVVLGLGAVALLLSTLAKLLAIYGYGFQHLIEASGPVRATVVLLILVALDAATTPTPYGTADGVRVLIALLAALLLCLCWLRSRGLWLGWGMWFGWSASTALLFGLPLGSFSEVAVVDARVSGPLWITGGFYGPTASILLGLLLICTIPVLIRLSDEYAWLYTRKPLVPAGIPVEIPPPAAHETIELPPAPPPSLVQIQPVASSPVGQNEPSN